MQHSSPLAHAISLAHAFLVLMHASSCTTAEGAQDTGSRASSDSASNADGLNEDPLRAFPLNPRCSTETPCVADQDCPSGERCRWDVGALEAEGSLPLNRRRFCQRLSCSTIGEACGFPVDELLEDDVFCEPGLFCGGCTWQRIQDTVWVVKFCVKHPDFYTPEEGDLCSNPGWDDSSSCGDPDRLLCVDACPMRACVTPGSQSRGLPCVDGACAPGLRCGEPEGDLREYLQKRVCVEEGGQREGEFCYQEGDCMPGLACSFAGRCYTAHSFQAGEDCRHWISDSGVDLPYCSRGLFCSVWDAERSDFHTCIPEPPETAGGAPCTNIANDCAPAEVCVYWDETRSDFRTCIPAPPLYPR